ncbi:hypothetical protein AC1031_006292 [Aphanomyces cochlioides]|nr:hypothetical protein AC1031_006292 [Aphanomyces cochlioides]
MVVTAPAFRQLMEVIPSLHRSRMAVALSGGADSTALLMLLHEYCRGNVLAITIDHGLRRESADEAQHVATFATKHNIPHQIHTVSWHDMKTSLPRSQLQVQARLRRYKILGEVCQREKINSLYVGHHLGDQLETVLFRLGRGSGWNGLSGMPLVSPFPLAEYDRFAVVRPLLSVNKDSLMATCRRFDQEWVEDPSNESDDFDRVRIRKQMKAMIHQHGPIAEQSLNRFQQHAYEAHQELVAADQLIRAKYSRHVGNRTIELDIDFINDSMIFEELAIRVLTAIIQEVGQKSYPPRVASVKLLWVALQKNTLQKSVTIGGCLARRQRNRGVVFTPEHVSQNTSA